MSMQVSNRLFSFSDTSLQKLMIKRRIVNKRIKEIKDNKNRNNGFEKPDYSEKIKKRLEENHLAIAKKKIEDELKKIWSDNNFKKTDSNNEDNNINSKPYKRFMQAVKNQENISHPAIDIYI